MPGPHPRKSCDIRGRRGTGGGAGSSSGVLAPRPSGTGPRSPMPRLPTKRPPAASGWKVTPSMSPHEGGDSSQPLMGRSYFGQFIDRLGVGITFFIKTFPPGLDPPSVSSRKTTPSIHMGGVWVCISLFLARDDGVVFLFFDFYLLPLAQNVFCG